VSVSGFVSKFIRGITSNEVLWQHEVEDFERLFPEIYRDLSLPESLDYRDKYDKLYPKVYELQARNYNYLLEHKITNDLGDPLDVYTEIIELKGCFASATIVRRRALLSRWNSLIALRQINRRELVSIKGLTEIPIKILNLLARFSDLRRLEFEYCAFEHLPDQVSRLVQLQDLIIKNTCLNSLPVAVCALTGLNRLELSDNNLSSIPKSLVCLRQLRFLSLKGNKIKVLPSDANLMSFLSNLGLTQENLLDEQLGTSLEQDPSTWPSYWSMRLNSDEQKIISG
jgi:hypothetical protein